MCSISSLGIIIVDDGSTDSSVELIRSLDEYRCGRLTVVKLNQRLGKAEAVRVGLLHASQTQSEYIGFYDIDFAVSFHEFLDIINHIESNDINALFGCRPLANRHWSRFTQSIIFRFLISTLLTRGAEDPQCGIKIFRNKSHIMSIFKKKFICKILFDFELIMRTVNFFSGSKIRNYKLSTWRDVSGSTLRCQMLPFIFHDLMQIFIFFMRVKLFHSVRHTLKNTT